MSSSECFICCYGYDPKSDLFPIIGSCGHTLCEECADFINRSSSRCPLCQRFNAFSEKVVNKALVDLMEERGIKHDSSKRKEGNRRVSTIQVISNFFVCSFLFFLFLLIFLPVPDSLFRVFSLIPAFAIVLILFEFHFVAPKPSLTL